MTGMVKRAAMVAAVVIPMTACGQDNKFDASVGADVVSGYVWRGQDLGSAAVQPFASVSCRGFSLGAWGSYGIADASDTKELDLTLAYTTGGLTFGVTDYWFSGTERRDRYFFYESHGTAHIFEANVGYDLGMLSLNWFTNFAGNDYRPDGKHAYSSYFEIAAPFRLGGLSWTAAVGCVPFKSSSVYTDGSGEAVDGFAVTNVMLKTTKDVKVTDTFSLPLFAAVTANPCSGKMYMTFGLSF